MAFHISRRALLKGLGATGAVAGLGAWTDSTADAATIGPEPSSGTGAAARPWGSGGIGFAAEFANPPSTTRPKVRWWLPSADVDEDTLAEQLASLAGAGFGGAELSDLGDGYGSSQWQQDLLTSLRAAARHDLALDVTLGPRWPAAVPTIDLNSNDAAQGIFYGQVVLAAGRTYSGPAPDPVEAAPDGVTVQTLLAVVAVRVAASSTITASPVLLDRATTRVIRAGAGKTLSFTAPNDGGTWLLLSFWQRSEGKTVNGWPVINHFRASGTRALAAYWESYILTPEISRLLRTVGADLFEDSIELAQNTHWTDGLLTEIRRRRGFDITPHLPVLMIRFAAIFDLRPVFDYPDGTGQRLRNDYFEVLSELYAENHLAGLRDWAHRHNMNYRCQAAYGATIDMAYAATIPDVPETETLWFAEKVDAYRSMAGGVHLAGKDVFSVETDVVVPPNVGDDGYATTFPALLNLFHGNFAGYINQLVFHGYPYPTSSDATWPGYSPFATVGGGLGESWGPRNPNWAHVPDLTAYLGRLQAVLRRGAPRVDVAIYRHAYWDRGRDNWDPPNSLLWNDPALTSAGYSYEYVDPHLFDLPGVTVKHGRLAPGGPAYKALVLTDIAEILQSAACLTASHQTTAHTAAQILGYARAGLPIVLIGAPPDRTPFFSDASSDNSVARTFTRLLTLHNVATVENEAQVPSALSALGVLPDAGFTTPAEHVWTVTRDDSQASYHYLYNEGAESTTGGYESVPVTIPLALRGPGRPFRLDAWTGRIEPLALYRTTRDRTLINLDLAPHQAAVVALAPPATFGTALPKLHATATTADDVRYASGQLVVVASSDGTYRTTLSDGRIITTQVLDVKAPIFITHWNLLVHSYNPGSTAASASIKDISTVLTGLQPWPNIAALQDVSGIGTYTASFTAPNDWSTADGAVIDLGPIANSARVSINGDALPQVDLILGTVDATGFIRPGTNTIQIAVTTTLNNKLRTLSGGSGRAVQQDGLLGVGQNGTNGIQINPYRIVPIRH